MQEASLAETTPDDSDQVAYCAIHTALPHEETYHPPRKLILSGFGPGILTNRFALGIPSPDLPVPPGVPLTGCLCEGLVKPLDDQYDQDHHHYENPCGDLALEGVGLVVGISTHHHSPGRTRYPG